MSFVVYSIARLNCLFIALKKGDISSRLNFVNGISYFWSLGLSVSLPQVYRRSRLQFLQSSFHGFIFQPNIPNSFMCFVKTFVNTRGGVTPMQSAYIFLVLQRMRKVFLSEILRDSFGEYRDFLPFLHIVFDKILLSIKPTQISDKKFHFLVQCYSKFHENWWKHFTTLIAYTIGSAAYQRKLYFT